MKENLFRGKRKDNGKWTEGYFYKIWDKIFLLWGMTDDSPNMEEVIPETVGQYTGLTDKNGTKIFESDIVRITTGIKGYESTYHSTIQKVRYETDECGIALFYPFDNSDMVEVEVIGNVYDNPELLEVGV